MFRRRRKKRPVATKNQNMFIRQAVIGVLLVTFVGLLLTGVWYGTRAKVVTITDVDVVGGVTIDHLQLRQIAEQQLNGTYYRLIPKRFTYLYPAEAIAADIRSIDRIKNVAVERTNRHTVTIVFEEYEPFALWCVAADSETCLFLDRGGYAFAAAPVLSGGAFVRFVTTNTEPTVGQSALEADVVRASRGFAEVAYDQLGLNIVAVTVDNTTVTYTIAGGGEVRTTTSMSTGDTLKNLDTILSSTEFSHLGPGMFDYIDLRFGNKVFVHEGKEEELDETATTTPAE